MATHRPRSKKKMAFLTDFAANGNITLAADAAGIARQTHYDWLDKDPAYKAAFEDAEDQAIDALENEARRRAMRGTDKPIFYLGHECGAIREYSDTLLIFLLKGLRPDKYRERVETKVSGNINHDHNHYDFSGHTAEELKQEAATLALELEAIANVGQNGNGNGGNGNNGAGNGDQSGAGPAQPS